MRACDVVMRPFRARIDGPVSESWRTALVDVGATLVTDDAWDLMLPPMGRGLRAAVDALDPPPGRIIGVLRGADALASKRTLWSCLRAEYGRARARQIVPETFLLDEPADHNGLSVAHRSGDRWVLKHPHKQARTGVRILADPRQARPFVAEGFVVLQRYVRDALLRAGHRLHVRRYLVVVVDRGRVSSYLADFGKCVYARLPDTAVPTPATALTTSLAGWTGPPGVAQTWNALAVALRAEGHDVDASEATLRRSLVACVNAARPLLAPKQLQHCRMFQIFGVDVLLDERLHPWILEANKRPEMRPRGAHDGPPKLELLRQTFRLGLGRAADGFVQLSDDALA